MNGASRLIGAFVFPDAWADLSRFRTTVQALSEVGVNAILTETASYEAAAIDIAHSEGLRFYAGVACFSDHSSGFAEIKSRPELWPVLETGERRAQMEWYVGITPTDRRHQAEVLKLIEAIATRYPIDGLFLDFVRWPVHWELEFRPGRSRPRDASFDPATLAAFAKTKGIAIPVALDFVDRRASWIHANHQAEWVDFKCKVVTDFVTEARGVLKQGRSAAELGAYLVPDVDGMAEPLTGQRLTSLAPIVDRISPMLYHNILLRRPDWIGETLGKVTAIAGNKTVPVLQVELEPRRRQRR